MAKKEIHLALTPLEFQMTCIAFSILSEILHGRLALDETPPNIQDAFQAIVDSAGSCKPFHAYINKLVLTQNVADVDFSTFTFGKH